MMPKGVEHIYTFEQDRGEVPGVRIPMMPKGVEHFEPSIERKVQTIVRIPMMPKGVEH